MKKSLIFPSNDGNTTESYSVGIEVADNDSTNGHDELRNPQFEEYEGSEMELVEQNQQGNDKDMSVGNENVLRDAWFGSYSKGQAPLFGELTETAMPEVIIDVDNRVRISPTTSYPWRAICALRITAADNTQWIGTGWFISPRTVMTAGHCVFMHNQGGWAKSIEVIPALNDAIRPFGSSTSSVFRSVTGWTSGAPNPEFDYGCIILPENSKLGNSTGWFGFQVLTDASILAKTLNLSGYPGDKGGNQQWFMSQKAKSLTTRRIVYNIDTMGGQSGAPVWYKLGEKRYAVGVHTNGHVSGNSATRIVQGVYNNMINWRNQGL